MGMGNFGANVSYWQAICLHTGAITDGIGALNGGGYDICGIKNTFAPAIIPIL
jgi:hypothetical protein